VIPAQIIIRILGMVATIILARNLTVASYGVYNLFLGAVLFFNFFTNMGLASSLQRFLSEYARLAKNGSYLRTFFFSIEYRTVTSVIVFALAVLFYNKFSSLFKVSEYKLGFILFCLGTFALFQTDYLELAFNTLFLHKYSSLGGLIGQTLRVVLIAVTLMVFAGGVTEVFASELVAYGIAAIFLWFFFNRQIYQPRKESFKEDKEPIEWKRILRFTAYNAATIPGGFFFSYALDYFVVASMASTNQL
jgi:O-antigen/teichoic acid export membrane protein